MFLDDQGDHLAVCAAHRREIGFTRRHNAVVMVLTRIACACGMQAQVHDRQIVDGFTERPGDWVEDTGPTGTSGSLTCCDLTIVGGSIQEAERHKQQKYAALLKAYPPLTLCVVAIGTDGRLAGGSRRHGPGGPRDCALTESHNATALEAPCTKCERLSQGPLRLPCSHKRKHIIGTSPILTLHSVSLLEALCRLLLQTSGASVTCQPTHKPRLQFSTQ